MVHFYYGADAWKPDCPTYFPADAFGGHRILARAWRGLQKTVGINSLFGDPFMARSLRRFLRRHNVSVVFSQYLTGGSGVQSVVSGLGLRHVVRGLGYDLSSALMHERWRRESLVLDEAAAIVVPSPYQVDRLRSIGLRKVPIHALPCGVDLPSESMQSTKARRGRVVHLVAAGRMVQKKAPAHLLKAFFLAVDYFEEMKLTIIGDGPLFKAARELCLTSPHASKVTFLGALPHRDMLTAVAGADIFIQHSMTDPDTGDQEGVPVSILEAMARGVPVISTRHSGIPYVVEDGVSGLLSNEGDVSGMANSIRKLAADDDLRLKMGESARVKATSFSWKMEKEALLTLLDGSIT